jgi:hypothetical protein
VATSVEHEGYEQQSAFDLSYFYPPETAPLLPATANTESQEHYQSEAKGGGGSRVERLPKKRKRPTVSESGTHQLGFGQAHEPMTSNDANVFATAGESATLSSKPKRVRTGCLTCRERHLKCDEGMPHCQNCRKSSRVCKRGVKLNFIDTQVQLPPYLLPPVDWNVTFQDESRDIASEYKGGSAKYSAVAPEHEAIPLDTNSFEYSQVAPSAPTLSHQPLPPITGILPETYDHSSTMMFEAPREHHHQHTHSTTDSTYSSNTMQAASYGNSDNGLNSEEERREYLNTQEEVLFMQVFVEEVGLWMDSMDPMKHVSRPS